MYIIVYLSMKQKFHNYKNWEDYINGMWRKCEKEEEKEILHCAIEFTGDHERYGKAMLRVIEEWKITCEHNLTNESINQKAFIGHCAVCLELGIPEYITRIAWGYLTEDQRIKANLKAEQAIKIWKQKYKLENTLKHGNKGAIQMEFQMKSQVK